MATPIPRGLIQMLDLCDPNYAHLRVMQMSDPDGTPDNWRIVLDIDGGYSQRDAEEQAAWLSNEYGIPLPPSGHIYTPRINTTKGN